MASDPFHTVFGRLIYTGHEHDVETGLTYMGARHYDPLLRTFLTQDPVHGFGSMPVTMSPYVYAANNPMTYTDPDGRFICGGLCIGIAAGVVIGADVFGLGYAATLGYQDSTGQRANHREALAGGLGAVLTVGTAVVTAPVAAAVGSAALAGVGLEATSGFGAVLLGGIVSGTTAGAAVTVGGATSELVATGTVTSKPLEYGAIAAGLGFTAGIASTGLAAAGLTGWMGLTADAGILLAEEAAFNVATGQDALSPWSAVSVIGLGAGLKNARRVSVEAPSGRTRMAAGTTRSAVGRRAKSRRMQAARAEAVARRKKVGGRRGGVQSYSLLQKAFKQQGLVSPPVNFKQKWSEGGFDFEVRIHPADVAHGGTGSIYRVGRRQQGTNTQGQGFGWEYIDDAGTWHPTSVLKPGKPGNSNPNFNEEAARRTHIPLP